MPRDRGTVCHDRLVGGTTLLPSSSAKKDLLADLAR